MLRLCLFPPRAMKYFPVELMVLTCWSSSQFTEDKGEWKPLKSRNNTSGNRFRWPVCGLYLMFHRSLYA